LPELDGNKKSAILVVTYGRWHTTTYIGVGGNFSQMRVLQFLVVLATWACTSSHKEMTAEEKQLHIDSLNGNYSEIIWENGIPMQEDIYEDYKLSARYIIKNGQVVDYEQVDSSGNVIDHLPLLVWDNSDTFFFDDESLDFKIENVDSLEYYVFYYDFDKSRFEDGKSTNIDFENPVDFSKEPLIKIPKEKASNQDGIFITWGYLKESRDSASYTFKSWILSDSYFKLR
jgi:hypothetical protein